MTFEEFHQKVYKKVLDVYEVFKHKFTEERVDLQGLKSTKELEEFMRTNASQYITSDGKINDNDGVYMLDIVRDYISNVYSIIVWWPFVNITNEHNESTVIYDLYAKVDINIFGHIHNDTHGISLNKATYTLPQLKAGYLHSHVSRVDIYDLTKFKSLCYGNSPLRDLVKDLKQGYDELKWTVLCEMLNKSVETESVEGVPYIRMSSIGGEFKYNDYESCQDIVTLPYSCKAIFYKFGYDLYGIGTRYRLDYEVFHKFIQEFILWYLDKSECGFIYRNRSFRIGQRPVQYILSLSKCFIDYINSLDKNYLKKNNLNVLANALLISVYLKNDGFYLDYFTSDGMYTRMAGIAVLTFKGEPVPLKITEKGSEKSHILRTLHPIIAQYIYFNISRILNYRYGTDKNRNQCEDTGEKSASAGKKVWYI